MSALERLVEFSPAFDRRHPDPAKNYGVHGVEMRMVVKDGRGAVQFLLYTNWHLPRVMDEQCGKATTKDADWIRIMFAPMAADLGYHSPFAQYEGQSVVQDDCPYLGGRPCYYGGSGLQARAVLDTLIREGGDAVWAILEERHAELFGEAQP